MPFALFEKGSEKQRREAFSPAETDSTCSIGRIKETMEHLLYIIGY
jgi:aminoglycoside N3'-acetyltransferase